MKAGKGRWLCLAFLLGACADSPVSEEPETTCDGGVGSATSSRLTATRIGTLEVGQPLRLSASAAACFRLEPSTAQTRYAIAYLEPTTVVDSGSWRASSFSPSRQPVDIRAVAQSQAPSQQTSVLRAQSQTRETAVVASSADERPAYLSRTMFKVGDRFEVTPSTTFQQFVPQSSASTGVVIEVAGNYLPVIVPEGISANGQEMLRRAFTDVTSRLVDDVVPFTSSLYGGGRPQTSAGYFPIVVHRYEERSGQGVVMIMRDDHVELALYGADFRLPFMLRNLTRAISYAFLMRSVGGYRDDLATVGLHEWGGSATLSLLTYEALRRARGIGFLDNWDIEAESPTTPFNFDLRLELASDGVLFGSAGATFLRYEVARLMTEAGLSHKDAMSTVVRSAPFGFYGCYQSGCSSVTSLAAAMRTRLGATWSPVDELLYSVLAQAADDLTSNPRLQNRSYLEAGSRPFGNTTFTTSGTVWTNTRLLSAGNGQTETWRMPQGSYGYVLLDDGGKGGTYSFATSLPMEWMLVRIR